MSILLSHITWKWKKKQLMFCVSSLICEGGNDKQFRSIYGLRQTTCYLNVRLCQNNYRQLLYLFFFSFCFLGYSSDRCTYSTRSPIDGRRLMSNEALLLLFKLFKLLLLLPSERIVFSLSLSESWLSSFWFSSKSSLVNWRWIAGIPFSKAWAGAASGTIRRKNPEAQPHGKILFCDNEMKKKS